MEQAAMEQAAMEQAVMEHDGAGGDGAGGDGAGGDGVGGDEQVAMEQAVIELSRGHGGAASARAPGPQRTAVSFTHSLSPPRNEPCWVGLKRLAVS